MNWAPVREMLVSGVETGVFSGASVAIATLSGELELFSEGTVDSSPSAPKISNRTRFDLASLTKVLATTTILARMVDRAQIEITQSVRAGLSDLAWNSSWDTLALADVLSHESGFAAWVDFSEKFRTQGLSIDVGSPAVIQAVLESIAETPPEYPARTKTLYSDLGFIVLWAWIEKLTRQSFAEHFEREVSKPLGLVAFAFNPRASNVPLREIAATETSAWRGAIHGDVHDDNAYLLGGLSGHAGLFGTALGCCQIGLEWLRAVRKGTPFLSRETAKVFCTPREPQWEGRRALGWDVPTQPGSSAGKLISKNSIGHLGYSGTSIWIDLERQAVVVLLTNRVHPTSKNEKIKEFRPAFHDRVWEALDA